MRVFPVWGFRILLLVFLLISMTSSQFVDDEPLSQNEAYMTHNYDRLDEVQKSCSSIIASASGLSLDDTGIDRIKHELTFFNGDWEQLGDTAPLMPFVRRSISGQFEGGYNSHNFSHPKFPHKFVSFILTDVSTAHRTKRTIGVHGNLFLEISSSYSSSMEISSQGPEFSMQSGHTQLFINFQGIFAELKKNGGERVLCLLGNTMLPSRQPDSTNPWESVKGSDSISNPPTLLQDDQIMLVLNYPKTVTLKHRAILGEMRSLNLETNLKYFDKVQITSQPKIKPQNYDFSSDGIVPKACSPYPYPDALISRGIESYKGHDFCTILERISIDAALMVAPHWRCNGTDEFCRKFGPFVSDKEINATDGSFLNARILIQDVLCLTQKTHENNVVAKVSAVFRAFDDPDRQLIEYQRTGLGNMTLTAEGRWNSSTGQLCMVGCLGIANSVENDCNSRICLYLPLLFSITQRSVLVGSISSIQNENPPYFPLSLEMLSQSMDFIYNNYASNDHPFYRYSKIDSAGTVLEKNEPFSFGTIVKRSLLTFPKLQDSEAYSDSLRLLAEDLALHVTAFPDSIPRSRSSRTDIQMEVLSLGPLFGRDWFSNDSSLDMESPYHEKATYTEKQLLLNVSTQLKLITGPYNFSVLFLEGLYDQHVGNMYMVGCRDVRASWKVLYESMDLENSLDCLIEVVISFPPVKARWLMNPSAIISISSKRSEDDPLYFKSFKLRTLPIIYRQQREEILSRRGFEGILKISALFIAIACILSQLLYTKNATDSLPYMSLVMLGSQVIGYALPLVIGAKALSHRSNSNSSETVSYELENSQLTNVIDYTVKLLVLTCFILTLRLFQKVWESRVRLLSQNPDDPHRVPSDKQVLVITVIIHVFGYMLALMSHYVKTHQTQVQMDQFVDKMGNSQALHTWEALFQEYVGLLQDLFLLPQVIGNIIWQINRQPLRKLYYMVITLIRLLPHVYDYIRGPVSNPFFSEDYEFVNQKFNFYSEVGDITIPVLAIVLAVIVYIQQKWDYEKLSYVLTVGGYKLLPFQGRMYQKLSTQAAESELVSCPVKRDVEDSEA